MKSFLTKLEGLKAFLDYDEQYDTVCIILDRDEQSFKADQYDEVLHICNSNGYKLGITNPCFEFWLLLHITDCKEYDEDEIRQNKKYNKTRRYLERLLIDNIFKPYISTAIQREKLYYEDPYLLKDNLGSSVGLVIEDLFI